MKAKTRLFGEIEIQENKIITLEKGIIGFPDLTRFTLIFDVERKERSGIMWLQSMDDGEVAMPVLDPIALFGEYGPSVDEDLLNGLGELTPENTYLLVTVTVPKQIEEISVNLKAPVIINTDTNKGCQIIVDGDYAVKHKIYDLLQKEKEKAGDPACLH